MVGEILKLSKYDQVPNKDAVYEINTRIACILYENGFSYTACAGCKRKAPEGDSCTRCGINDIKKEVYLFTMQLTDGTGIMLAKIIGEEGEQLIGKSAQEVMAVKKTGGNYKEFFEIAKKKDYNLLVRCKKEQFNGKSSYSQTIIKVKDNNPRQNNKALIHKLQKFANTNKLHN